MAKPEFVHFFIPTYVRFCINDWNNLKKLIIEHGTPIKDKTGQSTISDAPIPTDIHINNTLNGPFQGLMTLCLKIYSDTAKVRLELVMEDSDFFKRDHHHKNPLKIAEKMLKRMSLAESDNILTQINSLIGTIIERWREQASQWSQRILFELEKSSGYSFTDIEQQEFYHDETLADILERHQELNIQLPKLKKGEVNFAKYYQLKSTILLHSALNRHQKPNTPSDIKKIVKPLNSLFDSIAKDEEQLIASQKEELNNLARPLIYKKEKEKA
jgi:hypothetical protein